MTEVTMTKARTDLSSLVSRVVYGGERVVIHRHKDRAVLVSIEDAQLLEELEKRADLAAIRRRMKEPSEPWTKVKADLGL